MIDALAKREIKIMRLLSHPHIVRLYEAIETRSTIYMIMEYMKSGELFDYIITNGRLDENEARHYFQQVSIMIFLAHKHPTLVIYVTYEFTFSVHKLFDSSDSVLNLLKQ